MRAPTVVEDSGGTRRIVMDTQDSAGREANIKLVERAERSAFCPSQLSLVGNILTDESPQLLVTRARH